MLKLDRKFLKCRLVDKLALLIGVIGTIPLTPFVSAGPIYRSSWLRGVLDAGFNFARSKIQQAHSNAYWFKTGAFVLEVGYERFRNLRQFTLAPTAVSTGVFLQNTLLKPLLSAFPSLRSVVQHQYFKPFAQFVFWYTLFFGCYICICFAIKRTLSAYNRIFKVRQSFENTSLESSSIYSLPQPQRDAIGDDAVYNPTALSPSSQQPERLNTDSASSSSQQPERLNTDSASSSSQHPENRNVEENSDTESETQGLELESPDVKSETQHYRAYVNYRRKQTQSTRQLQPTIEDSVINRVVEFIKDFKLERERLDMQKRASFPGVEFTVEAVDWQATSLQSLALVPRRKAVTNVTSPGIIEAVNKVLDSELNFRVRLFLQPWTETGNRTLEELLRTLNPTTLSAIVERYGERLCDGMSIYRLLRDGSLHTGNPDLQMTVRGVTVKISDVYDILHQREYVEPGSESEERTFTLQVAENLLRRHYSKYIDKATHQLTIHDLLTLDRLSYYETVSRRLTIDQSVPRSLEAIISRRPYLPSVKPLMRSILHFTEPKDIDYAFVERFSRMLNKWAAYTNTKANTNDNAMIVKIALRSGSDQQQRLQSVTQEEIQQRLLSIFRQKARNLEYKNCTAPILIRLVNRASQMEPPEADLLNLFKFKNEPVTMSWLIKHPHWLIRRNIFRPDHEIYNPQRGLADLWGDPRNGRADIRAGIHWYKPEEIKWIFKRVLEAEIIHKPINRDTADAIFRGFTNQWCDKSYSRFVKEEQLDRLVFLTTTTQTLRERAIFFSDCHFLRSIPLDEVNRIHYELKLEIEALRELHEKIIDSRIAQLWPQIKRGREYKAELMNRIEQEFRMQVDIRDPRLFVHRCTMYQHEIGNLDELNALESKLAVEEGLKQVLRQTCIEATTRCAIIQEIREQIILKRDSIRPASERFHNFRKGSLPAIKRELADLRRVIRMIRLSREGGAHTVVVPTEVEFTGYVLLNRNVFLNQQQRLVFNVLQGIRRCDRLRNHGNYLKFQLKRVLAIPYSYFVRSKVYDINTLTPSESDLLHSLGIHLNDRIRRGSVSQRLRTYYLYESEQTGQHTMARVESIHNSLMLNSSKFSLMSSADLQSLINLLSRVREPMLIDYVTAMQHMVWIETEQFEKISRVTDALAHALCEQSARLSVKTTWSKILTSFLWQNGMVSRLTDALAHALCEQSSVTPVTNPTEAPVSPVTNPTD